MAGKNRAVSVQLSITAPKGTPKEIIERAIAHKCDTLEDVPGITIAIVDWSGRNGRAFTQDDAFTKLGRVIKAAHIPVRPDRES